MRNIIFLHPEIIWHIITSYCKWQFLSLLRSIFYTCFLFCGTSTWENLGKQLEIEKNWSTWVFKPYLEKKKKESHNRRKSSENRISASTSWQLSKRSTQLDGTMQTALLSLVSTKHEMWQCCKSSGSGGFCFVFVS